MLFPKNSTLIAESYSFLEFVSLGRRAAGQGVWVSQASKVHRFTAS